VDISYVTLHVGIGTFRPVTVGDPRDHVMHEETYELTKDTAEEISRTKKQGGRIIAVGTTTARVLEHCGRENGLPVPSKGRTGLKILPGYEFKVIDGMVTNFHLPKSTLVMLVCAFAGRENVMRAYGHAAAHSYRFFSYGDAMLIA
jgi:S-adenosylmethionine:tRNA ribosyltransferase-isomerase